MTARIESELRVEMPWPAIKAAVENLLPIVKYTGFDEKARTFVSVVYGFSFSVTRTANFGMIYSQRWRVSKSTSIPRSRGPIMCVGQDSFSSQLMSVQLSEMSHAIRLLIWTEDDIFNIRQRATALLKRWWYCQWEIAAQGAYWSNRFAKARNGIISLPQDIIMHILDSYTIVFRVHEEK
ncbi:hypothetical protein C8J57DRAFT_1232629 [Mycena rebaudengoi]|nr:hypothetical protein C8J57DRAFT_1232629 [Mycena rebaudengoi]